MKRVISLILILIIGFGFGDCVSSHMEMHGM